MRTTRRRTNNFTFENDFGTTNSVTFCFIHSNYLVEGGKERKEAKNFTALRRSYTRNSGIIIVKTSHERVALSPLSVSPCLPNVGCLK